MELLSDRVLDQGIDRLRLKLIMLGVVFWAAGVASIRLTAPFGAFAPTFAVVLIPATLPMAWLTVRAIARAAGPLAVLTEAVAIVSMIAVLLDGLVLTFTPGVYGETEMQRRAAAAWLLWFVGVSLAVAVWRRVGPPARLPG